jgi:hypothetical protein
MRVLAIVVACSLVGCATGESQRAYATAYKEQTAARKVEAIEKSKTSVAQTKALEAAIAKCLTDACVLGMTIALSNASVVAAAAVKPAENAIAVPADPALEMVKALAPLALGGYQAYLGAVTGIVSMTKGAADAGLANNALTSITPISPFAPTPTTATTTTTK